MKLDDPKGPVSGCVAALGQGSTDSDDMSNVGVVLPNWEPAEEKKTKRKIDLVLLPIVIFAFFTLQLDRGNLSNALTSTITKDLHINTNQINIGSQLFNAGIVVLELPSNMLMQRYGPRNWLSVQIFAWGLIATFQIFMTDYKGFLSTRLLLGLCEAGFVPGALYYVTSWYKKSETSFIVMIFFLGQNFASATANLIATGLVSLDGKANLAGWQWIFLVEGILTISAAVVFCLFLPPAIGNGKPLISMGSWSYFTERESHIMINRVVLDDPSKTEKKIRITAKDIFDTLRQPKLYLHVAITMISTAATHGLTIYTPSLIKSFGFTTTEANALNSVWAYGAMILNGVLAFSADRTGHRGPFVLIAATWTLTTYSCMNTVRHMESKWHKYAVTILANVPYSTPHILNVGWVSVHCKTPAQRSVTQVIIIMSASLGGIAGGQTFRSEDAPLYIKGFRQVTYMAAGLWASTAILTTWYFIEGKYRRTKQTTDLEM
ncbi:hypothetical protein BP6252_11354 [Coleophoma cylindrospora]|uniref:Major facilitator superfamily (MFS) profile domain-containing protein n=1 Tax=Coleophoma cylindrospora TaxID=1849047 RepID=A0A3D8QPS5_9HELO|nr:hypothetical protein BP6252_11354 [Coleophoma cylindrospora]